MGVLTGATGMNLSHDVFSPPRALCRGGARVCSALSTPQTHLSRLVHLLHHAQFTWHHLACALMLGATVHAWAAGPLPTQLPSGGQVVAGQASITQNANVMNIQQNSARAAIDWQTFNLGSAARVNFNQPSASSVTLNRVLDNNPSQIWGRITAPGQVFLVNPSGAYFAPSASVEVGSFLATTHTQSNEDFMAGRNTWSRNGATGSILNEGQLRASLGGYVALLAPEVRNLGVVVAQLGTVVLAAGEAYTLQFEGTGLLSNVIVTPATMKAMVDNGNAVQAPGGLILLSAQAASRLQAGVVSNTGTLQASGLIKDGGRIMLRASDRIQLGGEALADAAADSAAQGGQITAIADLSHPESVTVVSGRLSAQGGARGGDGGFVETSASQLLVQATSRVNTLAPRGKTGLWLLDPYDLTISSGADQNWAPSSSNYAATGNNSVLNASTLVNGLSSSSITVSTGTGGTQTGTITINADLSWSANTTLTLSAAGGIVLNNNITNSGISSGLTLTAAGAGGISGSGNLSNAGALTFNVNNAIGNGTLSGTLSGAGNITKSGSGWLTLSGNNTYTGTTTVSAGTLKVGSATALGANGGVTVASGAAMDLNGQTLTSTGTLTLNGTGISSSGALMNSSTSTGTYAGAVVLASAASIKGDTGLIALTNANLSGNFSLTLDGSAGGSIAGVISTTAASGVIKQGGGTWTLSGTNTYTGTTAINAGVLKAGSARALGASGAVSVIANAALDLNGQTMTSTGTLTINGTGISGGGALMNSSATGATYAGAIALGSSSSVIGSGGSISLTSAVGNPASAATLTLGGTAGGTLSGVASGSNVLLTKTDAGTWTLTGNEGNGGVVTINAGTLALTGSGALGNPSSVAIHNTGILDMSGVSCAGLTM